MIARLSTINSQHYQLPERLNYGDTIGIIAPASAPPDPKNIDRSVAALERLGFKPKLAPNVRRRLGFLAGNDRERAGDLMRMFTDPKVKAIICVRGGYGTSRLLPMLDYRAIRANPKIFLGYSDITSLHCAFLVKANLVSFHGPMLNSDFIKLARPRNRRRPRPRNRPPGSEQRFDCEDEGQALPESGAGMPDFTLQSFLKTLMQPSPPGSVRDGYHRKTVTILRRGQVSGPLIGGNITLLCATLGTPYQPSFRNAILFFEDLDEVPYRFDRMLTQLRNAGLLQQVAGIAIGINVNCKDPKAKGAKEYRQTLEDVFKERLLPLKIPIVAGLPFGHIPMNATLPVGVRATLDAIHGDVVITDPAVK